jgi:HEAT repeat protein
LPVFDKERKLKKIILLVLMIISSYGLLGQQTADKDCISLEEFTNNVLPQAKNQKSVEERHHFMFEQLERVFPRDKEKKVSDIKYIPQFFKKMDDEVDKNAVLKLFDLGSNFKEKNENIIDETIKLIDDDYPSDVRYASILILKQIKTPKSIPPLRKLIRTFPYTWTKFTMRLFSGNDYKMRLPLIAAIILGKLKDKESVPLLFDKLEELGPKGHRALAECGAIAVPGLLEKAREEIVGGNGGWAFKALLYIPQDDEEAKQILRDAFRNETDEYYKSILLDFVIFNVNGTDDRVFLKQLQREYEKWDKSTRSSIIGFSDKHEDREFILKVIRTEKDESLKGTALSQMGRVGNESDLPMLEEFAKKSNKRIRSAASEGIRGIKNIPLKTIER